MVPVVAGIISGESHDGTFQGSFLHGFGELRRTSSTYPARLVDELAALCPGTRLALDCGCGTGQLTVLLAERFERVVGTDAAPRRSTRRRRASGSSIAWPWPRTADWRRPAPTW